MIIIKKKLNRNIKPQCSLGMRGLEIRGEVEKKKKITMQHDSCNVEDKNECVQRCKQVF